jgi:Protein of unknown function (DUF2934)
MTKPKSHLEPSDPSSLDAPGEHPTHEEIAIRAYEIYEAAGRTEGHDGDHWLEAEKELKAKYSDAAHRTKATSA